MKNKNKLKAGFSWLIYVILISLVFYSIPKALVYALDSQYPLASIASGSMWPVLKKGDLVFIEGISEKENIEIGDIIVFRSPRGFTIHRVIEKKENSVITKGDANNAVDYPVEYEKIVGRALSRNGKPIRLPYLGNISLILNQSDL